MSRLLLPSAPLLLLLLSTCQAIAVPASFFRTGSRVSIAQEGTSCPTYHNGNIQQIKKRATAGPVYAKEAARESRSRVRDSHDYVFVVGLPFTGTTSLLSLLSTSPEVGNLCADERTHITCEGTWLLTDEKIIPETSQGDQTRWESDYPADWNEALTVYSRSWNMSKRILIDKSPPNVMKMLRIKEDLQRAGKQSFFIVLSRSPCYSDRTQRECYEKTACQNILLTRANEMVEGFRKLPSSHVLHIQYEEMVRDPYGVASKLLQFLPQLKQLDPTSDGLNNDDRLNAKEEIRLEPRHAGKDMSLVEYIESKYPMKYPEFRIDQSWSKFLKTFGY